MRVGCPKEIKNHEYRVGLTPESAGELVHQGNEVWIETGAGVGIGASDEEYKGAGARIVDGPDPIFAECEMVVKVKEPQAVERAKLRRGQVLYTYLHLAPDPEQTRELVASGVTAIAYETVTGPNNTLPLLKPMSQVAGRMSIQAGASALEKVGTIYACCVNPDQNLARPGRRFLDFVQFKLLADNGFHRLHHRFGHLPDPAL